MNAVINDMIKAGRKNLVSLNDGNFHFFVRRVDNSMETLEKLVRGLVGDAALQQIKDGSFELNPDQGSSSSGEDSAPLQRPVASDSLSGTLDNLNLAMGQLTILPESEGGTLYAGGTAWDAVFTQFAELRQLLKQERDQGGALPEYSHSLGAVYQDSTSSASYLPAESFAAQADDEVTASSRFCISSSFPFSNSAPPTLDKIFSFLPSKRLTGKLIESFFLSLIPFNKIIHDRTFMIEYEEFVKSPRDVKPGWLALLFTMCSAAVMMHSPSCFAAITDDGLSHEESARKFQAGARAALVHAQFLRSHTLNVIQALILLQISANPDDLAGLRPD